MNTNTGKTFVKGYMAIGFDDDNQRFEELAAVTPDGRVFRSPPQPVGDTFTSVGGWSEVEDLPGGMEFIGNYCTPKNLPEG